MLADPAVPVGPRWHDLIPEHIEALRDQRIADRKHALTIFARIGEEDVGHGRRVPHRDYNENGQLPYGNQSRAEHFGCMEKRAYGRSGSKADVMA